MNCDLTVISLAEIQRWTFRSFSNVFLKFNFLYFSWQHKTKISQWSNVILLAYSMYFSAIVRYFAGRWNMLSLSAAWGLEQIWKGVVFQAWRVMESWTDLDFSDCFNMFVSAAQKFNATMLDTFWIKPTNVF